uniref:FHA domain-containing protein n=1 Tax=Peronospora matthiolae TaxID=2874970 RepID=A0AAV1TK08_9STRA
MKRKHAAIEAATASEEQAASTSTAPRSGASIGESDNIIIADLDNLDVQDFLLQDCQASSRILLEQAKARADELRREFERGKKVLLDALEAEKEDGGNHGDGVPRAFIILVQCLSGPYRGKKFRMDIDTTRHTSCFIGRSTGRKFRPPRGLSVPKDSELSTSHGEIKMEATGKLFFIDLDSTNGTRVNNVQLEAHAPFELTLSKPTKVEVGGGEYEFVFEQKS